MFKNYFIWALWALVFASGLSISTAWALPDATYVAFNNTLTIPYVSYRGISYQAELLFSPPDTLNLVRLSSNTTEPEAGRIVPVNADLSFRLGQLRMSGDYYQAEIRWQQDQRFKVVSVKPALNLPIPRSEFNTPHFSGSGNCRGCHNGIRDDKGQDVSIISAWESTIMANSSRDPFWKAQVRREINHTPTQAKLLSDKCSRCHAPLANVEAKKQGKSLALFDDGILNPQHADFAVGQEGVSCTLCHQIQNNANFGTPAGRSGNFEIESFANPLDRKIYGPYENVATKPMQDFVRYTPMYGAHIKTSEHCASCHDLKTPVIAADGTITSQAADEFPEQMVYSEWLHSGYRQTNSCQQCHMKRSNGVIIASQIPGLSKRDNFAQHRIAGGNKLMLNILQDYREVLGIAPMNIKPILTETDELMRNAAELSLSQPSQKNGTLDFALSIKSKTGHKLPSAYPSRRVIVHLTVKDSQQRIVFESGKVNADGSVLALDSDLDPQQAEPHYDLITKPEQVQVYEDIMEDAQGKITYTLLRAKQYRKDNRLLPLGFDKNSASTDIKVVGEALKDTDFSGGADVLKFSLANLSGQQYTIQAELLYQTLGYAFAQQLFSDNSDEVQQFRQMFNASINKTYAIAQSQVTFKQ